MPDEGERGRSTWHGQRDARPEDKDARQSYDPKHEARSKSRPWDGEQEDRHTDHDRDGQHDEPRAELEGVVLAVARDHA